MLRASGSRAVPCTRPGSKPTISITSISPLRGHGPNASSVGSIHTALQHPRARPVLRNVSSMAKEFGPRSTANIRLMLSHARQADTLEVPDPYYGGEQGFEHVLDLLEDACEGLLDDLLASPPQG